METAQKKTRTTHGDVVRAKLTGRRCPTYFGMVSFRRRLLRLSFGLAF